MQKDTFVRDECVVIPPLFNCQLNIQFILIWQSSNRITVDSGSGLVDTIATATKAGYHSHVFEEPFTRWVPSLF